MSVLRSVYMLKKQAEGKFRVRSFWSPVRHWQTVRKLRKDFPDSWRWLILSKRIEGFLSQVEGDQLYRLARDYTPTHDAIAVEIGSWKGKSSVLLAAGLTAKQNPRLFCVDPFGPSDDPEFRKLYAPILTAKPCDLEEVFRRNMAICRLDHIVRPLRGLSSERSVGWEQPIDLLFIDGNHEYEAVLEDFANWSRFVRPGGVVAFHDVGREYEGPKRVVEEHLRPPMFGRIHRVELLAWAVKEAGWPSTKGRETGASYAHS